MSFTKLLIILNYPYFQLLCQNTDTFFSLLKSQGYFLRGLKTGLIVCCFFEEKNNNFSPHHIFNYLAFKRNICKWYDSCLEISLSQ